MNRDLFLAILAMDSYNRGYDQGIKLTSSDPNHSVNEIGLTIGNATIYAQTDTDPNSDEVGAGFYAIAYEWNGEKIISFRGTDNLNPSSGFEGGLDFWSYGIGAGQPFAITGGLTEQARLTIEFYQDVAGSNADPFAANITLTGHSLGGGLAGYAAMLYGQEAVIFANMAFEDSAAATHDAALIGSIVGLDTIVYGAGPIYLPNSSGITAFAVTDELLTTNRSAQSTHVAALESQDSDNLGLVELHSMALHTVLLWNKIYGNQNWAPVASELWQAFYSPDVATSIPGATALVGTQDEVAVIDRAIAYSAIDEGEKPFGDTAIWAMFDDAGDLGRAIASPNTSNSLALSVGAIAEILVQYAGKLALGKVEQASDADAIAGVITNNDEVLTIDFAEDLWDKGSAHDSIVGRETLINRALSRLAINIDPLDPEVVKIRSDLEAGLRWFANINEIEVTNHAELIDRVAFQISNGAFTGTVPDRPAGASSESLSLFVVGDGQDTITGSAENDFIHGSGDNDILIAGAGDDILAGGAGDDTFIGERAATSSQAGPTSTRSICNSAPTPTEPSCTWEIAA